MAVSDAYVFSGFLTPVPTQLFLPKPPTIFLTCFCRGERGKYAGKKICPNWEFNSQPPGHETDKLTTEPPGCGTKEKPFHKNYTCEILMLYHLPLESYGKCYGFCKQCDLDT